MVSFYTMHVRVLSLTTIADDILRIIVISCAFSEATRRQPQSTADRRAERPLAMFANENEDVMLIKEDAKDCALTELGEHNSQSIHTLMFAYNLRHDV